MVLSAFMFFTGYAGVIDLRTARITVVDAKNIAQSNAASELEKHLLLIAGERKPSADGYEFAIGRMAPGKAKPQACDAYAYAMDKVMYFWGDDGDINEKRAYGSLFAVYGFLDEILDVEWPRPGDDSIVCTKRQTVTVPDGWSYHFSPPMERSDIRPMASPKRNRPDHNFVKDDITPVELKPTFDELRSEYSDFRRWLWRMRLQTRVNYGYGHAFMKWNDRFYDTTNREYMAMWTGTQRGHHIKERGKWIHLCHSNPRVHDQIIRDWCESGTNRYLNICATDSRTTHCRCKGCGALDADEPGEDFLNDKSDRQVWLWNELAKKAIAIRPDVKLIAYIYANYRMPPRRWKIEYPDNLICGVVPSIYDDSNKLIDGWLKMGLKEYFVRPNYLCSKSALPRGLERYFLEDFKENFKRGMVGVDHDNFRRCFSMAVMFEFYALARVMANPAIEFAEVERDFLSQFGAAADEMKEYYARVRKRGEAHRLSEMGNVNVKHALDDSELALTQYKSSTIADLDGDIDVIDRALARKDITPVERRRIEEVRLVVEHGKLVMDFLVKGYREGAEAEFLEAADRLREFRLKRGSAGDMREEWQRLFFDGRSEKKLWYRVRSIRP